mmetsp:Transcript_2265/g.6765  ORF Transcript_2265/g.6765 Transcript_2265/m.6765 type:complete len:441 (+) Transcript_2265:66-1388(+)
MEGWWDNPDELLDFSKRDDGGHELTRRKSGKVELPPKMKALSPVLKAQSSSWWDDPNQLVQITKSAPVVAADPAAFYGSGSSSVERKSKSSSHSCSTKKHRRKRSDAADNSLRDLLDDIKDRSLPNVKLWKLALEVTDTAEGTCKLPVNVLFSCLSEECEEYVDDAEADDGDEDRARNVVDDHEAEPVVILLRILSLAHILLTIFVEADRKAFAEALRQETAGDIEPWGHILCSQLRQKTLVRYAKFLKLKTSFIRESPEFEGNYSLDRCEYRFDLEGSDKKRWGDNRERMSELYSTDTLDALLRVADAGMKAVHSTKHVDENDVQAFAGALMTMDLCNLVMEAKYLCCRRADNEERFNRRVLELADRLGSYAKRASSNPGMQELFRLKFIDELPQIPELQKSSREKIRVRSTDSTSVLCTFTSFAGMHEALTVRKRRPD